LDSPIVKQVLLETGWVEVRDVRVTPARKSVDGVRLGASVTFETREGRRTVPIAAVLDVYAVSAEAEAEAARLAKADQAERDARLFLWQHYTDRETYDRLAEAQNGRCGQCGVNLNGARFVHLVRTEEGPVLLHRDLYGGCSPLHPRLGRV
jgi:hypothetical protein